MSDLPNALLSCPFCGGEPYVLANYPYACVECNCGTRGRVFEADEPYDFDLKPSDEIIDAAVAHWNCRSPALAEVRASTADLQRGRGET